MGKRGFYYVLGKITSWVGGALLLNLLLDKKLEKQNNRIAVDKNVLYITDDNMSNYVDEHPVFKGTGILTIPNETDIVIFDTKANVSIHNVMPETGDFGNGKDVKIGGNFSPYLPSTTDTEEYGFSHNIYQDMTNNNGGVDLKKNHNNFIELTCWRKTWWFSV